MNRRIAFSIILLVTILGCSHSTSPTSVNLGIPPGATSGEYGYTQGGRARDSKDMDSYQGEANLSLGTGGLAGGKSTLSVMLSYSNDLGPFEYQVLSMPLSGVVPQTLQFGNATSRTNAKGLFWPEGLHYTTIQSGTFTLLKLDTVRNTVSGVFEYTAVLDDDPHDAAVITSGYFNEVPISFGAFGQGIVTATLNDTAFTTLHGASNDVFASYRNGQFQLTAYGAFPDQEKDIRITIQDPSTGVIAFANGSTRTYADITERQKGTLGLPGWSTAARGNGQITITIFDTVQRRISAQFQFKAVGSTGNVSNVGEGVVDNVQFNMP